VLTVLGLVAVLALDRDSAAQRGEAGAPAGASD
jgi:hypothetical protein